MTNLTNEIICNEKSTDACPCCGSENVHAEWSDEGLANGGTDEPLTCDDCGSAWTVRYRLVFVDAVVVKDRFNKEAQ